MTLHSKELSLDSSEAGTSLLGHLPVAFEPSRNSGKEATNQPPDASSSRMFTVIEPNRGWQLINFGELLKFRELLAFLVWRDIKVRYKQTLFGVAWAILQPALLMVVFTMFFGRLANVSVGELPYPIFVYAGLLPWLFFASSISSSANSVVGSERLITKVYFPRLIIPLASIGVAMVDFAFASSLLLGMMFWYRITPTVGILLVPFLCLLLALFAAGIGIMLAALNVAFRDFRYIIPFMVQLWMFATPTIYMDPALNGPGRFDYFLAANPLVPIISSFRSAVLGQPVHLSQLGMISLICLVMFGVGCLYFRRIEGSFSDII